MGRRRKMPSNEKISEWFYLHNKDIYHFFIYYIGSNDVEDLVQEVFVRAIKGFDTYEEKSSPKTWLFSIARNVAIDEIRRRKRAKLKTALFLQTETEEIIQGENPETVLELNERQKELCRAIQSLKSNYRDVIVLRGIKDLSIQETATILTWSENKVRITYHRALKALQKERGRFVL